MRFVPHVEEVFEFGNRTAGYYYSSTTKERGERKVAFDMRPTMFLRAEKLECISSLLNIVDLTK
jgi:hypothetical protein